MRQSTRITNKEAEFGVKVTRVLAIQLLGTIKALCELPGPMSTRPLTAGELDAIKEAAEAFVNSKASLLATDPLDFYEAIITECARRIKEAREKGTPCPDLKK